MDLISRVHQTIKQYNLIEKGDLIVVGLSGGPDSLALLHILRRLQGEFKFKIHAAHLDHSFRGKEAEKEALWVKEICQEWSVPCTVEKEDVPALAKVKGLSAEEAGHLVRRRLFFRLLKELDAQKIALGHHADDQAETVLMHFLTGAGLEGLRGIIPLNGHIIRPLLYAKRVDIEDYCNQQRLEPRRDPSNKENAYLRNKIRNLLIPWLTENINPKIVDTLNKTADIVGVDEEYLQYETKTLAKDMVSSSGIKQLSLDLKGWEQLPQALQRRLIRYVYQKIRQKQGLPFQNVEQVRELAVKKQGRKVLHLPGKVIVEKSYDQLLFYPENEGPEQQYIKKRRLVIPGKTIIPETQQVIEAEIKEEPPRKASKNCVFLPWKKERLSLYVRAREKGDRISPQGLEGSKKVKDYFIDKKVPRDKRDQIVLVSDEKEVLWIPGWVVSGKMNAERKAGRYLILKLKNINSKNNDSKGNIF